MSRLAFWKKDRIANEPLEVCAVGGCGNTATHRRYIPSPEWIDGTGVEVWLCNECDHSPVVPVLAGVWQALDPVTPEEFEEDRALLPPTPSPYANNIVLPSGR